MATQNYNLTINPNGGVWRAGFPSAEARPTGTEVCIRPGTIAIGSTAWNSITKPTRTGYWFAGWWTSETDGIMVYDANSECVEGEYWTDSHANEGTYRHEGDMVLYARWYAPYTISFNLGGAGTRPNVTSPCGSWVEIANPEFDGHVFDGWMVTGHDKTTSEVSIGGAVSGMGSDPMIVHAGAGESISVRNLSNGGAVVLTAIWRTEFGGTNAGCPTIEFPAFTPICSKGGIGASAPASFDVPVPVYAPIVPPPECVCLSFADAEDIPKITVRVDKGNKTGNGEGTARVEIESNEDCCDGGYKVKPIIDIVLPECDQEDSILSSNTVSLANGDTVTGGRITYTLKMVDCIPQLEIKTTPLSIRVPSGGADVCFVDTTFKLSGEYTLGTGANTAKYAAFEDQSIYLRKSIVPQGEQNAGCWRYTMDDITLDLSSVAFGNGGSVFKDSATGNLYTDGSIATGVSTWYGGGIGDYGATAIGATANNASVLGEDSILARSTRKRNDRDSILKKQTDSQYYSYYVPYVYKSFRLADLTGSTLEQWSSNTNDDGAMSSGSGNLCIPMPTGFQWEQNGVAINIMGFEWNPSGLLANAYETGYAAVVAPAMTMFKTGVTVNSQDLATLPSGGLQIIKPGDTYMESGLSVNDGYGLRIFGCVDKTDSSEVTAGTVDRVGRLEVDGHDKDFTFDGVGRLTLNDEKSPAQEVIYAPVGRTGDVMDIGTRNVRVGTTVYNGASADFGRTSDLVMDVVVCDLEAGGGGHWTQESSTGMRKCDYADLSNESSPVYKANKAHLDAATTAVDSLYDTDSAHFRNILYPALKDHIIPLLGNIYRALTTLGLARMFFSRSGSLMHVTRDTTSYAKNQIENLARHRDDT